MKTVTGDPHEFVEAFERRYLSLTELPGLSRVERYDPGDPTHRERRYLQVGVRTSFPVEVVESWEPGFVARQVVDGIERTELSVVAEAAGGSAEDVVQPRDVEGLLTSLAERDVDHLLAPKEGGVLEMLRAAGEVDRRPSDDAVVVGAPDGREVELHLHSGEGAYGLPDGVVDVVRKTGDDVRPPEFDFFDGAAFNHDRRLMVYFGDDVRTVDGERYFDLLYRVVFSRPEVGGEVVEIRM